MKKRCSKCKVEKDISEFGSNKSRKDGLNGYCRPCANADSKEKKSRLVIDPNTGETIAARVLTSRKNRSTEEGREKSREASLETKRRKVLDPNTGEIITAGTLSSRKRISSGWYSAYCRNRRAVDPLFKLRTNIASLIRCSMQRGGFSKSTKTAALLGCDFEFFQLYIEEQFQEGMSWENNGEWHYDHKIPCSAATDEVELIALQHFSNFQPMWGAENLSKSGAKPDGWEDALMDLVHHTYFVANRHI